MNALGIFLIIVIAIILLSFFIYMVIPREEDEDEDAKVKDLQDFITMKSKDVAGTPLDCQNACQKLREYGTAEGSSKPYVCNHGVCAEMYPELCFDCSVENHLACKNGAELSEKIDLECGVEGSSTTSEECAVACNQLGEKYNAPCSSEYCAANVFKDVCFPCDLSDTVNTCSLVEDVIDLINEECSDDGSSNALCINACEDLKSRNKESLCLPLFCKNDPKYARDCYPCDPTNLTNCNLEELSTIIDENCGDFSLNPSIYRLERGNFDTEYVGKTAPIFLTNLKSNLLYVKGEEISNRDIKKIQSYNYGDRVLYSIQFSDAMNAKLNVANGETVEIGSSNKQDIIRSGQYKMNLVTSPRGEGSRIMTATMEVIDENLLLPSVGRYKMTIDNNSFDVSLLEIVTFKDDATALTRFTFIGKTDKNYSNVVPFRLDYVDSNMVYIA